MKVHIKLRLNRQSILESHETLDFRRASGAGSAIGFVTLVGTATGAGPFVGPVTVKIGSGARGAGVWLARFAPHAVGTLSVDETIGVYDWENVELVFGEERGDVSIGSGKELIDKVFGGHLSAVLGMLGKKSLRNEG